MLNKVKKGKKKKVHASKQVNCATRETIQCRGTMKKKKDLQHNGQWSQQPDHFPGQLKNYRKSRFVKEQQSVYSPGATPKEKR